MPRKMAMFPIRSDRFSEAIDVARRYSWNGADLWLVHHNGIAEIWDAKPPNDHRPYAHVERYDGTHWTTVR